MRIRRTLCLSIAALLTAVAGCGDDDSGPSTPDIDITTLNSGNYPIVPWNVEATRTPLSGPTVETIRIGAVMPVPFELDSKYIHQRLTRADRTTVPGTDNTVRSLDKDEFAAIAQGLVAGWATSAERRPGTQSSVGSSVSIELQRYSNADTAAAAATAFADRQALNLPGDTVEIPGFPRARAKWSISKRYLDAWLAHNDMVLHVHSEDPVNEPAEPQLLAEFTQKAFTRQIEMLAEYRPTPLDRIESLPLDTDGLLSRTLPLEERQRINGSDQSRVLPTRAALHLELEPTLAAAAYSDAGVDLVAYANSRVYRARDHASAQRLIAGLIAIDNAGWSPIDSPPNMPGVQCFDTKDKKVSGARYAPACFLTYERYAARVSGQNIQELHQMAAAQYKLLAHTP
ncbi:hypothetical protein ACFVMC_01680 [Nocardia sp. NPDC127579]|uniref:DUF7373 family lipoprotein n=1 Tax=Nocardia sp. NPDC127579 TaxID=3345402 RepID=UPI00364116EA